MHSLDTFKPAHDRSGPSDTTSAVWPNQDPAAVGSRPLLDLNGDGTIDSTDDYDCARQAFGPGDGNVQRADGLPGDAQYYSISGFDVAPVPTAAGGTRYEIHYALFWTKWGLNNGGVFSSCGASPGSIHDDPRQLGYDSPPENTVLTWNSFFRDYVGAVPNRGKNEIVLYLGGNAKTYDSRDVSEQSWRLKP